MADENLSPLAITWIDSFLLSFLFLFPRAPAGKVMLMLWQQPVLPPRRPLPESACSVRSDLQTMFRQTLTGERVGHKVANGDLNFYSFRL